MIYLDTSLVVALCAAERDSDKVEAALAAIEEPLCTSEWTRVEFTRAVGIKVRNRELRETLARRALAGHHQAFEPVITVITPSRDDYCYTRYDELDIRERLRRLADPNDPTQ